MATGGVHGGLVRHHLVDSHGMGRTILPSRNVPYRQLTSRNTHQDSCVRERTVEVRPTILDGSLHVLHVMP